MSELSISDITARITQIETLVSSIAPQAQPQMQTQLQTQLQTQTSAPASFASTLAAVTDPMAASANVGENTVAAAETQLGVAEQPPGSNDSPQIAMYRGAVAGAQAGEPWCAYFASWASAQAGAPLGSSGQGLGSVAEITSWAQQTGRYLPAGSAPQPGDLMLFGDEHVGIVESVNPDGSLTTIEGNYNDAVSQVHRMPSEATGFVRPSAYGD
jgi:hypothetical protein